MTLRSCGWMWLGLAMASCSEPSHPALPLDPSTNEPVHDDKVGTAIDHDGFYFVNELPDANDVDAGNPEVDSGMPEPDAGPPPFDAGTPDSGTPDSGTPDAGTPDAGRPDAGQPPVDAGMPPIDAGPPPVGNGYVIYSGDRTLSPIDATIAQHLRDIAARGNGRAGVFSKVGDSISTNGSGVNGGDFLNCFDGPLEDPSPYIVTVRMGRYSALVPTIEYFQQTLMGSDDSWTRVSLSTQISRTANWALTSSTPPPIDLELNAANPRYAVVMYGSNDIGYIGPYSLADAVELYERNMRTLTDRIIARGVIPLLTTMPPDQEFFRFVPLYAGVVRGIAQGRQIPLIDYYKELVVLPPPHGLRSDGVHPNVQNFNTPCWFDDASLIYGYNIRNLITLQSLDRMRKVFDGATPPEPNALRLAGDGSPGQPFIINSLPFGELRDLRASQWRPTGQLSCSGTGNVAGPQYLYRFTLTRTTSLRIIAVDGGARAQRVSLLSNPSLASCMQSDQRLITTTLQAGTYYVVLNAGSSSGGAEYNLSVTECVPGDPDC